MSSRRDDIAARICRLAATHGAPGFAWLDGSWAGRSWFGMTPAERVCGQTWSGLDAVERRWRARPQDVWIGWLTYDLGAAHLRETKTPVTRLPACSLQRYEDAVSWADGDLVEMGPRAGAVRKLVQQAEPWRGGDGWPLDALQAEWTAGSYRERVDAARRHIVAGDTYQVNLSQPFRARWLESRASLEANVAALYQHLRDRAPAPMGALLRTDDAWIVSNSPETLLRVEPGPNAHGPHVATSWPIKGTRPRHLDPCADAAAIDELVASDKDRAEHTMIVDLVRNDLGRLAEPGSVVVSRSATVLSLPTVHHLVSEIRCTLRREWTLSGVLEALFPGGSITGAPKRRTVEIIEALEGEPREIYCGAVILLAPDGVHVSIPIRTAVADAGGLRLRSGGGIVFDSDPESERLETIAKARAFATGGRAVCSNSRDESR